jgi:hypothetical protein
VRVKSSSGCERLETGHKEGPSPLHAQAAPPNHCLDRVTCRWSMLAQSHDVINSVAAAEGMFGEGCQEL